MFTSWKIGRVAGIDLFLHPTFLLLLLWTLGSEAGGLAVAFTAAVFGCVLLHELGHALTARLYGIQTRDITLYPIGGVARLERLPRSPKAELAITLAGPLTNVAIAGVLAVALGVGGRIDPSAEAGLVAHFVGTLLTVNLALAAFNMIPAFPMDGGRILRALLSLRMGRLRATEVAASVGQVLAVALPLTLLSLGYASLIHVLLGVFVFFAAGAELAHVQAEEAARPGSRPRGGGEGIWTAPPGYRWVSVGPGTWQLVPVVSDSGYRPWR